MTKVEELERTLSNARGEVDRVFGMMKYSDYERMIFHVQRAQWFLQQSAMQIIDFMEQDYEEKQNRGIVRQQYFDEYIAKVELTIKCRHCGNLITFSQRRLYEGGTAYNGGYCDKCKTTFIFDIIKVVSDVRERKDLVCLEPTESPKVRTPKEFLPQCECEKVERMEK